MRGVIQLSMALRYSSAVVGRSEGETDVSQPSKMVPQRLTAGVDGQALLQIDEQFGQRPLGVGPGPEAALESLAPPAVGPGRKVDGVGLRLAPDPGSAEAPAPSRTGTEAGPHEDIP